MIISILWSFYEISRCKKVTLETSAYNLPDSCITKKYIFKTNSCKICPNIENCKYKQ